ncbi:hypothetical protein JW824_14250 [bacterium]|nr:hypothetical protein [bacterium]
MTEKEHLYHILKDQFRRHAEPQVVDIYKLVYQISFGTGHLLEDEAEAKALLQEEWEHTEKSPSGEALIEVIDPLDQVIRINLRIYKKVGGKPGNLFDLIVRSAQLFQKDPERLMRYWQWITEWAEDPEWPFAKRELDRFWIEVEREHFPPKHHSQKYVDAHRPSYRIVLKRLWMAEVNHEKGI